MWEWFATATACATVISTMQVAQTVWRHGIILGVRGPSSYCSMHTGQSKLALRTNDKKRINIQSVFLVYVKTEGADKVILITS